MRRKIEALVAFYSVIVFLARQAAYRGKAFRVVMEHSKELPEHIHFRWVISLQASDEEKPETYVTTAYDPRLFDLMGVVAGAETKEGSGL